MSKRLIMLMGLLVLLAGLAQPASAQVMIGSNATGQQATLDGVYPMPGQVIRPPDLVGPLTRYTLWIRAGSPSLTVTPIIYEWDNLAPVGPPVWTGDPVTVTSTSFTETVFPVNLSLDPNKHYWLTAAQTYPGEYGWLDGGSVSDYPDGYYAYRRAVNFDWGRSLGAELRFSATFADLVVPPGVPTLGEWALVLFAVMLAGGAALYLQRRSRVAT